MKLTRFMEHMEQIAPASLAWERDNVGLLIGTRRDEIRKILVALDCTAAVAREAAAWGADLVLTHHPLFFQPIQRIDPFDPDTAASYVLIENGIALFAAHTNLDAASGGVNDVLCRTLGLADVRTCDQDSIMRTGMLDEPTRLRDFAIRCQSALGADAQVCGDLDRTVHRIVVVGGAGGGDARLACALGADVLVTGEARHHDMLAANELGLALIVLGHHQTEAVVLESLISRLQPSDFDVQYKISRTGRAPFTRPEGGYHE